MIKFCGYKKAGFDEKVFAIFAKVLGGVKEK
jgi:hypothetical protein